VASRLESWVGIIKKISRTYRTLTEGYYISRDMNRYMLWSIGMIIARVESNFSQLLEEPIGWQYFRLC
jgi:hypothetical protein